MRGVVESAFARVADAMDSVELDGLDDAVRWPDEVLRAALIDAERLASRLRGAQARLLAEASRRDLARRDGCASSSAWLSQQLGVSGGEAFRRLDEMTAVTGSPEVAAALERGEITPEHARTIGSTLRAEPAMSAPELLDDARRSDAGRFANRAARLRRAHQADGGLSQFEAQRRARVCSLHVRADDGMVVLRGEFDPLDGARLRAMLLARSEQLWRQDHPGGDAGGTPGDPPPIAPPRTNAQRMADALVELCAGPPTAPAGPAAVRPRDPVGSDRTTGSDGGPRSGRSGGRPRAPGQPQVPAPALGIGGAGLVEVEVLVTIDYATLISDLPGTAEVLGVGPIPAATARRLACEAGLIPVVLGGDGETLDIGRSRRLANRSQRRALRRHHQHCAWAGCTIPFEWCQIHHVTPWKGGGRTDLANLVPLCNGHHHLVHEGGWTIRPAPGMEVTVHAPTPTGGCARWG